VLIAPFENIPQNEKHCENQSASKHENAQNAKKSKNTNKENEVRAHGGCVM